MGYRQGVAEPITGPISRIGSSMNADIDVDTEGQSDPGGEQHPILTFEQGLPGFAELRRFEVVPMEGDLSAFSHMASLERTDIQFVVAPPGLFFNDYMVEIDDEHQEFLGIKDSSDVVVLIIVTIPHPPAQPTANLLGPIVVNRRTLMAAQVVQYQTTLPSSAPLPIGGAAT